MTVRGLAEALKQRARAEGFGPVGIALLETATSLPARTAALRRWLEAGHGASMGWMRDPRRQSIEALLPGVRSVLAVGLNYWVEQRQQDGVPRIGRYGWGRDYHRVIDGRLRAVGRWLSEQQPDCRWRACVDSAPLMDKAWAEAAGLGWIGKHSNLINRSAGSWLLLGHLLTDLCLEGDAAAQPLCGSCSLCLDACPTDAISEPFVVDSRRCIGFHTVENREASLPREISSQLQGWVAGCDICQEVCPWNREPRPSCDPQLQPRDWVLQAGADALLNRSDGEWDAALRGSALRRIKPWMWRRNIRAAMEGAVPGTD